MAALRWAFRILRLGVVLVLGAAALASLVLMAGSFFEGLCPPEVQTPWGLQQTTTLAISQGVWEDEFGSVDAYLGHGAIAFWWRDKRCADCGSLPPVHASDCKSDAKLYQGYEAVILDCFAHSTGDPDLTLPGFVFTDDISAPGNIAPRIGVRSRFCHVHIAYWLIFLVTAPYPAARLISGLRRRLRRSKPGACAACGYDLRGNVSGRCPECGKQIDARKARHTGAASASGFLKRGQRSASMAAVRRLFRLLRVGVLLVLGTAAAASLGLIAFSAYEKFRPPQAPTPRVLRPITYLAFQRTLWEDDLRSVRMFIGGGTATLRWDDKRCAGCGVLPPDHAPDCRTDPDPWPFEGYQNLSVCYQLPFDRSQPDFQAPGFELTDDVSWTLAAPPLVSAQSRFVRVRVAYWLILLIAAPYPAMALISGLRRRFRRPKPGACAACGYDLRGNVSVRCPECGRVIEGGRLA